MDTLTILLATFTSIFKLLVVPSSDVLILTDTWTAIRQVLPKCLSEVQRAVAEVWAAVIRRLKVVVRDRVVHFLAETIEGAEDATAWVVVYACKVSFSLSECFPLANLLAVSIANLAYFYRSDIRFPPRPLSVVPRTGSHLYAPAPYHYSTDSPCQNS